MRKYICMIMMGCMIALLGGCGGQTASSSKDRVKEENSSEVASENNADETSIQDCVELLDTVWNSLEESQRFAAAGGDFSEENQKMDAPGKYGLADAVALDSSLGFPEAEIGKIDDAASLMHMMNANTFTSGAFHVSNKEDVAGLVDALKDNILKRQWMCGFPDKLVIVTQGDYIVAMFGENELVDTFKNKMETIYPTAKVEVDVPIQ